MDDRSLPARPSQPAARIPVSRGELRRRFDVPGTRRTALVTGATGTIGKAVSSRLAGIVDTLLLHGRNPHLLAALAATLAPANPGTSIVPVLADFSSLADVWHMIQMIKQTFGRLHILVNNAATVGPHAPAATRDGHDLVFQVNYLAPVLLAAGLFDLLRAAKNGRVVNIVCDIYRHARAVGLDFSTGQRQHLTAAYAKSKFALAAHTAALSSALAGEYCSAVCVDPGMVDLKLRTESFQRPEVTVSEAADNILYGITMPANPGGFYVRGKKLVQPEPEVLHSSIQRQLSTVTEELLDMSLPWTDRTGHTPSVSG